MTCGHCSKNSSAASLLSAITDIMAANSLAATGHAGASQQSLNVALSQANAGAISSQSIAVPSNQGPL